MNKILVADASGILAHTLAQHMPAGFEIRWCGDGDLTLKMLEEYRPDVLVLHLMLPHTDGLGVLQRMQYRPRVIMAITNYVSSYIERMMAELGVDYTMIAPSTKSLKTRLLELIHKQVVVSNPNDPKALTTAYLHLLGIPTHLEGYRFLCLAIPYLAKNPNLMITKELYPTLAKVCKCKDARAVEHVIRTAIQTGWTHRNDNVWCKYFPKNAQGQIPCPTNKEFICCLTEFLRR